MSRPRFEQYLGDDPHSFVADQNIIRRHLNESQRAMIAARMANLKLGDNQYKRQGTSSATTQEHWEFIGPVGSYLNGRMFENANGKKRRLIHTSVLMDWYDPDNKDEPEIFIFRDRAYWPCDYDKYER